MKRLAIQAVVSVLIAACVGCGRKAGVPTNDGLPGKLEQQASGLRPEIILQIRRHPYDRGNAVRVRLDVQRLHDYDISAEDVVNALTPSGLVVDPTEPTPPPGVILDDRLLSPDQYKEIILRANSKGDIVRLKDVANVEAEPPPRKRNPTN